MPDAWGTLLAKLFEHELVTLLSQADVSMLSKASAALVLYDHLRSFMALKSSLKSSEPQADVLRPAHEALLNFTARLFMAAHQAILNDIQKEGEAKPHRKSRERAAQSSCADETIPARMAVGQAEDRQGKTHHGTRRPVREKRAAIPEPWPA